MRAVATDWSPSVPIPTRPFRKQPSIHRPRLPILDLHHRRHWFGLLSREPRSGTCHCRAPLRFTTEPRLPLCWNLFAPLPSTPIDREDPTKQPDLLPPESRSNWEDRRAAASPPSPVSPFSGEEQAAVACTSVTGKPPPPSPSPETLDRVI